MDRVQKHTQKDELVISFECFMDEVIRSRYLILIRNVKVEKRRPLRCRSLRLKLYDLFVCTHRRSGFKIEFKTTINKQRKLYFCSYRSRKHFPWKAIKNVMS